MFAQQVVEILISVAEMAVGIGMFASGLERRERHRWVLLALSVAGLLALGAVIAMGLTPLATSYAAEIPRSVGAIHHALVWSVVPVIASIAILAFARTSVWTAIYCAAAGYTIQNLASSAADFVELILGSGSTEAVPLLPTVCIEVLLALVVYVPAWRLLARPFARHGLATNGDSRMLALLGIVLFAVILFDTANKQLVSTETPLELVLLLKAVHGVVCVFVLAMGQELLVNRHLREDALLSQSLLQSERRQYELSRENIEAINIKCHDIKHQIRRLGGAGGSIDPNVVEDIARQVDVYDSMVRTGNDALDVILSEKGLVCDREGIDFRCMADGTAVSFMAPTDIYSLFGNAIDNAIEASRKVAANGGRSIALTVRAAAGMASIHVENRFDGNVVLDEGGLPVTSKSDSINHGFGTRSMQLIAQRYDGVMTMRTVGDTFHLNIAIPLPE